MNKTRKILRVISLVAVLVVLAAALSFTAVAEGSGSVTFTTSANAITQPAVANVEGNDLKSTGGNWVQYEQKNDPNGDGVYTDGTKLATTMLDAYVVKETGSSDPYVVFSAGEFQDGMSFQNVQNTYAATNNVYLTNDAYYVVELDVATLSDTIESIALSLCNRDSKLSGFPFGENVNIKDFVDLTGEWVHFTVVGDIENNKLHIFVNGQYVTTTGYAYNTSVTGTKTPEEYGLRANGMKVEVKYSASANNSFKILKNQSIAFDNVCRRDFIDAASIAELDAILASADKDLTKWSKYPTNTRAGTSLPAYVEIDGVKYNNMARAAEALESSPTKVVKVLSDCPTAFIPGCDCTIIKNGFSPKIWLPQGSYMSETNGVISVTGAFKTLSSIAGDTNAGTYYALAATKVNSSSNVLNTLNWSGIQTGNVDNALISYVVTDLNSGNKYWTVHNNGASGAHFINLLYNQPITYDASKDQYLVYDFDFALLGAYDPNYVFHTISRNTADSSLCGGTSFKLSSMASYFPIGEMKHVTVVYDLNNNKSYFYVNNTLVASSGTGVMTAAVYDKWKAGTATVKQEAIRMQNVSADQAFDNISVRHITNDSSLKAALGSSLSSWTDAVYTSSYNFQQMHAAATVNGQNVYFEDQIAGLLSEARTDGTPHQVEILRELATELFVPSNAVIETHGLAKIKVPGNMKATEDGTCVTVEGKGDMSLVTTVKLPSIYQSGMVFQRGENITVRGYCESPGSQIEVKLDSSVLIATTDDNCDWEVVFPAMSATTGLTLTVTQLGTEDGKDPIALSDVAIGEVFLLSGQSNMDYNVQYMEDYLELKANANNYTNLRGYLSANTYRHGEDGIGSGRWCKLTADNIAQFPATGYAMATVLAMALGDDVTVAIVEASYPGSTIKTWIDAERYIAEYGEDADVQKYRSYLAFYEANGRCPTSKNDVSTWTDKWTLSMCYDAILAPLKGYKVKAVVWDQGSGDLGRYTSYSELYALMQETFNETLGMQDVPFIMHNLVPRSAANYKSFLLTQYDIAANDENTYLVSMGYEGAVFNSAEWSQNSTLSFVFVHTSRKSPIGYRAANVILENLYGIDADSTPMVDSVVASGSSVVITLTEQMMINYGTTPILFEIAGSDGKYHSAEAVISGNTVTLTCADVSDPKSVRYAYADFVIELNDGTIIAVPDSYSGCTMTADALTIVLADGTTYTINKDGNESIRSYCTGNVTSEAGVPLPAFELEVGYSAD